MQGWEESLLKGLIPIKSRTIFPIKSDQNVLCSIDAEIQH